MRRPLFLLLLFLIGAVCADVAPSLLANPPQGQPKNKNETVPPAAQDGMEDRLAKLEKRVDTLDKQLKALSLDDTKSKLKQALTKLAKNGTAGPADPAIQGLLNRVAALDKAVAELERLKETEPNGNRHRNETKADTRTDKAPPGPEQPIEWGLWFGLLALLISLANVWFSAHHSERRLKTILERVGLL